MITNIKIPAGYTVEQVKAAMDTLAIDPNYACLLAVIESNDMAKLREEIEDPNTDDKDLKEKRYRLAVFKQLTTIASAIGKACEKTEGEGEEESDDPYHTEKTLQS